MFKTPIWWFRELIFEYRFCFFNCVFDIFSGLVSDAFHLTFGCGLLTFSLFAMDASRKKPDRYYTYGWVMSDFTLADQTYLKPLRASWIHAFFIISEQAEFTSRCEGRFDVILDELMKWIFTKSSGAGGPLVSFSASSFSPRSSNRSDKPFVFLKRCRAWLIIVLLLAGTRG